ALDPLNLLSSVGAYLIGLAVAVLMVNTVWSSRRGATAGNDPWSANTLEWATPSPPPPYNFARIPVVRSRDPLWDAPLPASAPEATIFALLLASYVYLGVTAAGSWPPDGEAPRLAIPILGTALLMGSSAPMAWAEAGIRRGDVRRLLVGLGIAALASLGFLAV